MNFDQILHEKRSDVTDLFLSRLTTEADPLRSYWLGG